MPVFGLGLDEDVIEFAFCVEIFLGKKKCVILPIVVAIRGGFVGTIVEELMF